MTHVLIPFDGQWLALPEEQFREAVAHGQEITGTALAPTNDGNPEQVLTAEGMESVTSIPASWFLEAARQGRIPHIRAGKYVRFRLNGVLDVLSVARPGDRLSPNTKTRARDQSVTSACYHVATKKSPTERVAGGNHSGYTKP